MFDIHEVSNETDVARSELIAYNSEFDAGDIDSDLEKGRREAIFFSVENVSGKNITIYADEWDLVGQDDFLYGYIKYPYREFADYPAHYPRNWPIFLTPGTKTRYLLVTDIMPILTPGTKTRYLLVTDIMPNSTNISVLRHNFMENISILLELPDQIPNVAGNPPL
jgi:hypothetical protein